MKTLTALPGILLGTFALVTLTACGPRVSVHFHEDDNFNVTAYASEQSYSVVELEEMVTMEASFLCGGETHSLGEQDCDLGDGQLCYSAVFCCGEDPSPE